VITSTFTVHRFEPMKAYPRYGRIPLDIDARQARRQYRCFRADGFTRHDSRVRLIHLFCKAVDE
jgi:hypothetical protein